MNYEDNKIDLDRFHKAIAAIVSGTNYDSRRDMYFIDPKTIKNWQNLNSYWTPKAVSSICPHCDALTTFPLTAGAVDQSSQAMDLDSTCPNCEQKVSFFAIDCARCDRQENPDIKAGSIWMYPEPQKKRESITVELLPSRLLSAYKSAIKCFNQNIWTATVTECGRILEGIAIDKIPNWNSEKNLNSSLKLLNSDLEVTGYVELFKPILQLADALRLGRNKSAHFDFEKEPDKDVATEILDLTEKLIEYFYVIPSKSQELSAKIKAMEDVGDLPPNLMC